MDSLIERTSEVVSVKSYVENNLRHLYAAFEKARENQNVAAEEMVKRSSETQRERTYQPGQEVWVSDPAAHVGGKRKLGMPFKGPGIVSQAVGNQGQGVVYKVKMPDGKESTVHHNRLKPFVERKEDEDQAEKGGVMTDTEVVSPKQTPKEQVGDLPKETLKESPNDTARDSFRDLVLWWESEEKDRGGCQTTRAGRQVKPVSKYQAGTPSGR